jgi:hypothetical protein
VKHRETFIAARETRGNMNKINIAAGIGCMFFTLMLCAFTGMKIDQSTVAILTGALVGLMVAIPTCTLIFWVGLRRHEDAQPVTRNDGAHVTNNHYHLYVVNVERGASDIDKRLAVASQLRIEPRAAKQMIDAGQVKFLPAAK